MRICTLLSTTGKPIFSHLKIGISCPHCVQGGGGGWVVWAIPKTTIIFCHEDVPKN